MASFFHDLAYSVRLALRRPVLTVVTILTLGVGIGGNSAIFSLVNALFLRPLPVERPRELIRVFGVRNARLFDVSSYANLSDIGDRAQTFAALAIHQQTTSAFGLGDSTENADIELVSGNYFQMLGVSTGLGRTIAPMDDVLGKPEMVAVVSDAWWKTRLGQRATAVGETIHLNGTPFTVIGVAPSHFRGSYDALATDIWVPLMTYETVRPRNIPITNRSWGWLSATARLAHGASLAQAQADVDRVVAGLRAEYPRNNNGFAINLVPATALPEAMTGTARTVLLFALLVAALALAAACANVANAQIATVFDRRREIAVRLALGASRARIARQWLTECLLIAAVAAATGTIGAMWLRDLVSVVGPPEGLANFGPSLAFDIRLVLFSTFVIAVVTVLFGGLPAVRAAQIDIVTPLKEDGTTTTSSRPRAWAQAVLVAAQVAVSVALLISSALLTRSLGESRAFDVGFDSAELMIASPAMANLGFDAERGRAYYADTTARVRALPGVKEVTLGAVVPLGFGDEALGVVIDGYSPPDGAAFVTVANNIVATNYFSVMRIPIRRGRGFVDADGDAKAPVVAVVNETMARSFWTDGNPVGKTIRIGNNPPAEIVGIAADITYRVPGEAPHSFLYVPFGPVYFPYGLSFHVRAAAADASLARALRRELRTFDPRIQVPNALPYEELRQQALYPGRALAAVSSGFGVIAVLLAIAGIYGVMAHVVASRQREFAVRLTLGARPRTLVIAVLRQGIKWTAAGLAAGVLIAVALAQLLEAFLFNISVIDAWAISWSVLALSAISLLAAYAPARRVLRIEPAATLRS